MYYMLRNKLDKVRGFGCDGDDGFGEMDPPRR